MPLYFAERAHGRGREALRRRVGRKDMANVEVENNAVFRNGGRRATDITVRAIQRHLQGVLRHGKSEWQGRVLVRTGGYRDSIHYRTRRNGEIVRGSLYSTMPIVRQIAMEDGLKEGREDGNHRYADNSQNRRRGRVGQPWRAVPGTGARDRAFRIIKGLLSGPGLENVVVKDLNRG